MEEEIASLCSQWHAMPLTVIARPDAQRRFAPRATEPSSHISSQDLLKNYLKTALRLVLVSEANHLATEGEVSRVSSPDASLRSA